MEKEKDAEILKLKDEITNRGTLKHFFLVHQVKKFNDLSFAILDTCISSL